jgi:hypothetical protein
MSTIPSTTAASAAPLARGLRRRDLGSLLALLGYGGVAVLILLAWSVRDDNLVHAESGLGYLLGILGTTLMALLLLYPLRKRVRALHRFGPTRIWFRVHMLFGILGPLLIILHTNFRLGSINGRVALISTLVVAGSGIVGRYIYAKLHYGLYGRKASLDSLRGDVETMRDQQSATASLLPSVLEDLARLEDRVMSTTPGLLAAFTRAVTIAPQCAWLGWRLKRVARRRIDALSGDSSVIAEHRPRLAGNTGRYIDARLRALRKFAQFRAFETLFSLWHIVHYPLFLILILAVIVHVLAVHMY